MLEGGGIGDLGVTEVREDGLLLMFAFPSRLVL